MIFLSFRVLAPTGLSKYPGLKDTLVEMYSNGIDSLYLMATLIDISEEELEGGVSDPNCLEQALEVCWMPHCTLHFNSLHPNISMCILHTVLYMFPELL